MFRTLALCSLAFLSCPLVMAGPPAAPRPQREGPKAPPELKVTYRFRPIEYQPGGEGMLYFTRKDGTYATGFFDPAGNFRRDPDIDIWEWGLRGILSGPNRFCNMLPEGGPFYEYRSGYLIKVEFIPRKGLVPVVGSKVMRFADYKYSPDAPVIWNLPGKFEEVKDE